MSTFLIRLLIAVAGALGHGWVDASDGSSWTTWETPTAECGAEAIDAPAMGVVAISIHCREATS